MISNHIDGLIVERNKDQLIIKLIRFIIKFNLPDTFRDEKNDVLNTKKDVLWFTYFKAE